jgi:hypothetical protein
MIDKYEAAELLVVGRAQDVILGIKEVAWPDNTTEPPPELQVESLSVFDE